MKIKCDETKPSCRQCLKRKLNCPGYKRDLRWSDKHEVFSAVSRDDTQPRNVQISLLSTGSPDATRANSSHTAFQLEFTDELDHNLAAQSASSVTDATSLSPMSTRPAVKPNSGAFSVAGNNYEERSSTDIFRDDLREWLVSHEPMSLLQQQDWTWTLSGPSLDCDDASTFEAPLDCREAAAVTQGGEINQALIQYFFNNLCCIHSVLDDTAERFKALVRRYLSSSPLLHKSIVCMSAAHCFQDEESMLPMCLECHSEAFRSLSEAVHQIETVIAKSTDSPRNSVLSENDMLRKLEKTLLASIILGFCAPWSDPRDLGLPHLRGARRLCEYLVNYISIDGEAPERAFANADHFFLIGAMAYWEACMAFVVDQPKDALQYLYPFSRRTETTYIHMFAGISLPLFVTLGRVGICVRQKRALRSMAAVGWKEREAYQLFASEVLQDAIELEQYAVNYCLPADETFDTKTLGSSTYRQIKAFAQMCRFAILLELRRNFPNLVDPQFDDIEASVPGDSRSVHRTTKLSRCYFDLSTAALSHAQDIPEGSTCGLYQTLLLIICGSALRSSKDFKITVAEDSSLGDKLDTILMSTLARQDETDKARAFVRRRLQTNCASFGLGRVYSRAEVLLEDVWKEVDADSAEADNFPLTRHWIDIMAEHKLETFFG
ncbi:hypothetical protein H2200_009471 [Cladophialophora chaetospira]|uniref:Zn(2)-C6 fungal-type domain-containing protein n=1 Tax=Cladophialophora chaetospira TaxID=386627 RepID=A0AA38X4A3_9EURO|nr:hypothetical protein H2200_009471 [Cladophialophora chaetospira]